MPSARNVFRPTLPTRSPGQVAVGLPQSVLNSDSPARLDDLRDGHVRQIELGVDVRANRVADQAVDAGQGASRVRSVEHRERRAALEREDRARLPSAEQLAHQVVWSR